jgi:hydroxyethylthiazole kinase-like uncharacterized protein yjeF
MPLPPLYHTAQIRLVEQQHGADGLMEKAGQAIAQLAATLANEGKPDILILAGPGNNGGDAFVAARLLKERWQKVHLVFTGEVTKLPPDARAAFDAWLACGGTLASDIPEDIAFGLVIDGLFGIGLTRPLEAPYTQLIRAVNQLPAPRLAIDIPSGLCADTGRVLGATIRADHTLTFIGLKPGLFTLDGPDHAGQVHWNSLGTAPANTSGRLVETPPCQLPPRPRNSHKGSFGSVAIIGGDSGMVGAALLAGRAALLAGSGRVFCHLLANDAPLLDMAYPELMLRHADAPLADNINCIIVGPGMGRSEAARNILADALQHPAPLVLDADALHLLAADAVLNSALRQRGNAVLTPHPGEAAALLHSDTSTIQADRVTSAQTIARQYNAVVILKGVGSVIAVPDGNWYINTSGNPGLSSAGMGDVLAGIIGALIAQGLDVEHAALLGAYLHGQAADRLVAQGIGPVGLTASEVAEESRNLLNQ